MAHDGETRRSVRVAYVQGLPLEAAAERFGIPFRTASRWKAAAKAAGDDWDRARASNRIAGEGIEKFVQTILEDYLPLHQATMEAIRTDTELPPLKKAEAVSRLADAFHKTVHAAGEASPEISKLAVVHDVLHKLSKFVVEKYPTHGPAFVEILEPFALEAARIYG
jgi:hypothetical protein